MQRETPYMRYRSNTIRLPGSKGLDYSAWILSWLDPVLWTQAALPLTSEIFDDLGYGRVNPLHSYQIRASRKAVSIKAYKWPGKYEGEVSISNAHMHPGYLVENTLQDLGAWATKGAARARPLDPVYDAAVVVGELTEAHQLLTGLSTVVATAKRSTRSKREAMKRLDDILNGIGDAGLWTLFGVVPTARALADLNDLANRLDSAVSKALRDNGKWEHVNVDLLNQKTSKTIEGDGGCWPEGLVSSWIVSNRHHGRIVSTEKIWFEADLRYNLPQSELGFSSADLRRRLTGTNLDGRVLYELMPYSWLLDWFTSAGSVVSNAMDHTLYQWRMPCIMHESKRDKSITGTLVYRTESGKTAKARPKGRIITTVKRRAGYVFGKVGLTLGELNNFQAAIGSFFAARSG